MTCVVSLPSSGLALVVFTVLSLSALSISAAPANAVVYCKTVGVPQGCVVRPVAPVARAVARPGTPMNRGGPVNRVGRR
jgi:hypothetical protein